MDEPINIVWDAITTSAKKRFDYDSFVRHFESDATGLPGELLLLAILFLATDDTLEQATDAFVQECLTRNMATDYALLLRVLGRLQRDLANEVQALKLALRLFDQKQEPESILQAVKAILQSAASPPIEVSIREGILDLTEPYLKQCYWHKVFVQGNKLEVLIKVEQKDISDAILIRVTWSNTNKEIHIPNILMPDFMRQQGIGKGMIKKVYEIAKAYGYSLFIVQMTRSFFNCLKKRGAKVITDEDCVQITDATNLENSQPC